MTTTITLYGVKTCQTVKKARAWLEQHDKAYRYHDVRVDGLTSAHLDDFVARTDWKLLLNRSSTAWRQLSPEQQADLDQDKAMALLLAYPTLMKRPVLDTGGQLLVGFTPERYASAL
ncbi:MAG: arsenate reductase [Methylovulum sp.]|uniref:arsenate reductase n=1 Tax=Methylovulum sp. TaxID=1916980 RepID=UPI0026239B93|nr:arsenate reductase [Methylovulum sp.]MDD2723567.1 arsenate reductase [Methylovulum sp.]MDD5124167.1 arsenate reductase [Methylovulum sp.]